MPVERQPRHPGFVGHGAHRGRGRTDRGVEPNGGFGDALSNDDLIEEKYRGIRPAFGYPACPDHSEKGRLFELLGARSQGLDLTESYAMTPAASVSGLYFGHPSSKYFAIQRIGLDQVEDYAKRKNMAQAEVERWLRPVLAYEPALAGAAIG